MLQFFRNMFKTKVGVAFALIFLGLIAVAFASADISGNSTFGGVAGGDRVAVVGDEKVGTADLSRAANRALDRVRQEQNPTASMPAFVAGGGLDNALEGLIDRFAMNGYARKYGLRAGENLINSEIRAIPAFRGADGNFNADTYRQAIAQQGVSDAQVRDDLSTALIAQQLFIPASYGTTLPGSVAKRYAQLFKERRQGAIALLPAAAFAPKVAPTEVQLKTFYDGNRNLFIRPERRLIRFASFDVTNLGDSIEPTEAEIAARYRRDAAQYAASETRSVTQLIVPTEAAAKSISQQVAAGASFDDVARNAGLRTAKLDKLDRNAIRNQTSKEVSDAYFAASQGSVTAPARSPLGWHIARVDAANRMAARTLAQVRGEIADAVRIEKRASGLSDLALRVEEQIADGATLAEIASELKVEVQSTRPVTANGLVYGSNNETAPAILAPALATAFQMDEEEPEIAPIKGGQTYLLFEVGEITQSATAPLSDVRDAAVIAWRQTEGAKAARAAADRVLARLKAGATFSAALAQEKVALPAIESINLTREDLAKRQSERIPAPLALLFSMANGTSKRLEAEGRTGWYIVDLDSVVVDSIASNDPLIAQASTQLAPIFGQEYIDQLRLAMREELGVERNQSAIDAVRKQLTGGN